MEETVFYSKSLAKTALESFIDMLNCENTPLLIGIMILCLVSFIVFLLNAWDQSNEESRQSRVFFWEY